MPTIPTRILSVSCALALAIAFAAWPRPSWSADKPTPSRAEVQKEVSEALEALRQYSIDQRDEALRRARQTLDELDERMEQREAELRDRWSEMSKEARMQAGAAEEKLKERREELAEWYGGLKHGSRNAWDELKKGFSRAYGEFSKAWKQSDDVQSKEKEG